MAETAIITDSFEVLESDVVNHNVHNNEKDSLIELDPKSENIQEDDNYNCINNDGSSFSALEEDVPDDLKEPEEPDHHIHCPSVSDDKNADLQDQPVEAKVVGDADPWMYILGHNELMKRVIKKGNEKGRRPVRGQLVEINCKGSLEDGRTIDDHENLIFTLGEEEFLTAFDLCIPLMYEGEICELVAGPRFAYGQKGREPDIPPNSKITYQIELNHIQDRLPYSALSISERLQEANMKREKGNKSYEMEHFTKAIDQYAKALEILQDTGADGAGQDGDGDLQSLLDLRMKCYNNLAAAQMKISAWQIASLSCDEVLKVQPDNVKALFRKAECLDSMGETDSALSYMKQALKLQPGSKQIQMKIARLEKKMHKENESARELYRKMLGTHPSSSPTKKKISKSWGWYMAGAVMAAALSIALVGYRYS